MAQTLRDWYRYLERQMHVSLPEPATPVDGPPDPLVPAIAPRAVGTLRRVPYGTARPALDGAGRPTPEGAGRPAGAEVVSRAALDAEAHAAAVRRRLGAGPDQRALPMELGPQGRGRGGRRPITESREEIIRRLLDPELSLHEAAAVLNLSKATVRRYTDQGKLACLRTEGGQRRFRLSALLGFLDVQSQARGETGA